MNDIHFPFECRTRYSVAMKILQDLSPSRIYLNGDIVEFQGVSSWPVHPSERGMQYMDEILYANKRFDELMELFPDVPVTYICGNHEHRLYRFIRDLAPQLWGVMPDCPQLLQFDRRPYWKFIDYTNEQLVQCGESNLYLRHEPLGGGKNNARMTAENSCVDIAFGHTHTWQSFSHKKFGPRPFITRSFSLGFLGDKSRHVFDYRGSKDNWIEGITIVECDEETGAYTLEFIDMRVLPVLFRGKLYTAA